MTQRTAILLALVALLFGTDSLAQDASTYTDHYSHIDLSVTYIVRKPGQMGPTRCQTARFRCSPKDQNCRKSMGKLAFGCQSKGKSFGAFQSKQKKHKRCIQRTYWYCGQAKGSKETRASTACRSRLQELCQKAALVHATARKATMASKKQSHTHAKQIRRLRKQHRRLKRQLQSYQRLNKQYQRALNKARKWWKAKATSNKRPKKKAQARKRVNALKQIFYRDIKRLSRMRKRVLTAKRNVRRELRKFQQLRASFFRKANNPRALKTLKKRWKTPCDHSSYGDGRCRVLGKTDNPYDAIGTMHNHAIDLTRR